MDLPIYFSKFSAERSKPCLDIDQIRRSKWCGIGDHEAGLKHCALGPATG
jgi:hypothetical protein